MEIVGRNLQLDQASLFYVQHDCGRPESALAHAWSGACCRAMLHCQRESVGTEGIKCPKISVRVVLPSFCMLRKQICPHDPISNNFWSVGCIPHAASWINRRLSYSEFVLVLAVCCAGARACV